MMIRDGLAHTRAPPVVPRAKAKFHNDLQMFDERVLTVRLACQIRYVAPFFKMVTYDRQEGSNYTGDLENSYGGISRTHGALPRRTDRRYACCKTGA